jgi:hypothetical protein
MSRPYDSSYSQKKSGQDIDTKIVECMEMFSGSVLMLLHKFRSKWLRLYRNFVPSVTKEGDLEHPRSLFSDESTQLC